jgi:hypothetical protein
MGTMDDLIAKYNELTEAEKRAKGATDDILESAPDLIKAYDELAKNIFKAGGSEDR